MKNYLFLISLYSCSAFTYVIESESIAEKNGLVLYPSVQACNFYPEIASRPFYFKREGGDHVKYDVVIQELKARDNIAQIKCLEKVVTKGDKIYRFDKTKTGISEVGYIVFRGGVAIALVFTLAMYS